MKICTLRRSQKLPISLEESWEFFSNPKNLSLITPPSLGLEITSEINENIYEGMIITYKFKPFPGIVTEWVTEITHIEKPFYFADEQRFGPYVFWHHKHFFKNVDTGVETQDLIHYALPLGPIGRLVNSLYVKKSLDRIFDHRSEVLKEKFCK